jgi:hypothetical protein
MKCIHFNQATPQVRLITGQTNNRPTVNKALGFIIDPMTFTCPPGIFYHQLAPMPYHTLQLLLSNKGIVQSNGPLSLFLAHQH